MIYIFIAFAVCLLIYFYMLFSDKETIISKNTFEKIKYKTTWYFRKEKDKFLLLMDP